MITKRALRKEDRPMARSKRRRLTVDLQVQGALARRLILHWASFVVVTMSVMFAFYLLADPLKPASEHLHDVFSAQFYFIMVALVMLPAFIYDSLQLSNRFAGPIVRIRRSLKLVSTGQPVEKISFRKGDFWADLADEFNAMLDRVAAATQRSSSPVQPKPGDQGGRQRPIESAAKREVVTEAGREELAATHDVSPVGGR